MGTDWNHEVKNLLQAGLDAVAMTAERSVELVDELVKKGELTVAQGKAFNEELRHGLHKKGEEAADILSRKGYLTVQTVLDSLEKMDAGERALVRHRLEELENRDGPRERGGVDARGTGHPDK